MSRSEGAACMKGGQGERGERRGARRDNLGLLPVGGGLAPASLFPSICIVYTAAAPVHLIKTARAVTGEPGSV